MEHESILQMGTDKIIPTCAYNKLVMVKFPDKCEWQNRFNPDNKGGQLVKMCEHMGNDGHKMADQLARQRLLTSIHST
jgi:hypothetical protein